jgi:transcriptional regulator with XRE-family HTH domain
MSIGNRLHLLREHLGYTQKDFALKLGLTHKTYWRYESDEGDPQASFLVLVMDKFGTSSSWLLTGEGEMFSEKDGEQPKAPPDEIASEVMNLMTNLDEQGKQAVLLSARQADRIVQLEKKLTG